MTTFNQHVKAMNSALIMLMSEQGEALQRIDARLQRLRAEGGRLFIAGNGGSASTAGHMACDLSKSPVCGPNAKLGVRPLKVMALADQTAIVTAYANDLGYDAIFDYQLDNWGQDEDVLLVLSVSGNSSNIIQAMKRAFIRNMETIVLTGFEGGQAARLAHEDYLIKVQSTDYGIVEDCHAVILHWLTNQLCDVASAIH